MEIRVFKRTAEMKAYEVTASVSEVEIFGIVQEEMMMRRNGCYVPGIEVMLRKDGR
jgi:hypothetical protein